ncbi:MAG: ribose 5-phosphate isomerase B [Candidatus Neomarinimicrobiota bacterium]
MRIAFGADHGGYILKNSLIEFARSFNHSVIDCGSNSSASVDYPDYARAVCEAVNAGQADVGVLVCRSGVGMCISANKIHGIRAVVGYQAENARQSRRHNHTNVLCFGADFITAESAGEIMKIWIETPYSDNERHIRRVEKMMKMES